MDQRARMAMLASFRDGKLKLLVASDVAARGLDIPDVSHIFNYDVPIHAEDYVHRIGRTARAGRSGKAFTIVTKSDVKYLDAIERLIGQKIEWHDGDLSTVVASEGGDDEPRRGRGKGGKERGERGGRREGGEKRGRGERHAKPRAEASAEEIAEQPSLVPASVIDARRERKQAIKSDNSAREAKPERAEKKPERAEQPRREPERPRRDRNERPDRTEQNRRQREQDDDGTVGFGDDMPAFMKVDVKV